MSGGIRDAAEVHPGEVIVRFPRTRWGDPSGDPGPRDYLRVVRRSGDDLVVMRVHPEEWEREQEYIVTARQLLENKYARTSDASPARIPSIAGADTETSE